MILALQLYGGAEEDHAGKRLLWEHPVSSLVLSQPAALVPTATKTHLAFIDGLRAIAALFVMVCHAYFEPANGYYASRLMNHLGLTYGHVAVDLFIVVSGFCLMLPIAQELRYTIMEKDLPGVGDSCPVKHRTCRKFPSYFRTIITRDTSRSA